MNNLLRNVTITGLWDSNDAFNLKFDPTFNFIIGKNGTGKTTVINLLAAALTADYERLDKIPFKKIEIKLGSKSTRKRASIEVVKEKNPNIPIFDINYSIKESSNGKTITSNLDSSELERMARNMPTRVFRERFHREKFIYIQRQLENMITVNWLSVHRHPDAERTTEEKRFGSAIDTKLANLHNQLVRYFSKLGSKFSEEAKNFQKASFLSLTGVNEDKNINDFVKNFDIEEERRALASVFELLEVDKKDYQKQVDKLATELSKAKQPYLDQGPITLKQLFAVLNSYKAHNVVQEYESLQSKRKIIFEPRDKFLRVINSLFAPRKRVSISQQNEIVIKNTNEVKIELEDLSSGEKQLLIILGQALLQESAPVVYIADEPELSLHVDWQEKLTLAIFELNPNAQIVFATHSPDIVGSHSDRIMDMESFIS